MMMPRPIAASAAAMVITKTAKTCPARSPSWLRERDEVDVHGVEDQLEAHQHGDEVAPHHHADQAER